MIMTISFPPLPQAFKLEHPGSGRLVHAGVLEFTSPSPDAAYVPQWMLEHLQAKEGRDGGLWYKRAPKSSYKKCRFAAFLCCRDGWSPLSKWYSESIPRCFFFTLSDFDDFAYVNAKTR